MHVEATVVIAASPKAVFDFIARPENGPRWQEAAVRTEMTTQGPIGLGSRMVHEGRWLGVRVPSAAEVDVFEPDRHFGYAIESRMSTAAMHYDLEPVPGGTRLTLTNDAPMRGPLRLVAPLLERGVQGMFDRDVARLKQVIEAEAAGTSGS